MNLSTLANHPFDCSCTPPAANVARAVVTWLRASFPQHADLNARHTIPPVLTCLLKHGSSDPVCHPPSHLAMYIHMVRHAVTDRARKDQGLARAAFEASCALLRYHRSFATWFEDASVVSLVEFDLICTIGQTLDAVHDIPDFCRGLVDIFMANGTPECLGDMLVNEAKLAVPDDNRLTCVARLVMSATSDSAEATVGVASALWQHGVPQNACAMLGTPYDNQLLAAAVVSIAYHSFVPFFIVARPEGSPWPTWLHVRPVCDALLRVVCQPGMSDGVRRRAILTLRLMCDNSDLQLCAECPLRLILSDDFLRFISLLIAGPDAVETPDTAGVAMLLEASCEFVHSNNDLRSYQDLAARLVTALALFVPAKLPQVEAKLVQALHATAPTGGTNLLSFLFGSPLRTLASWQRNQYTDLAGVLGQVRDSTTNDALREACTAFLGHVGWVRTRCGNPACTTHESVEKLKICARCQVENYCGEACQKTDWPRHKKACKT